MPERLSAILLLESSARRKALHTVAAAGSRTTKASECVALCGIGASAARYWAVYQHSGTKPSRRLSSSGGRVSRRMWARDGAASAAGAAGVSASISASGAELATRR